MESSPSFNSEKAMAFQRLVDIMDTLREKCPWDRKQTMLTLKNLTIEETYELADAIVTESASGVKEELGDLMLHLIFYGKIAEENNLFTLTEALHAQCEKLIHRHPHIYGNLQVKDEEEVKKNWEKLKLKEGKKSVLQGVPNSLPAMIKAYRIQDKAAQVKFEWEHTEQVWEKVKEEMNELETEWRSEQIDVEKVTDEFGDLMFALINLSRYLNIDPETALEKTNSKFIRRFKYIEEQALKKGVSLHDLSLAEMEVWWIEAKQQT